MDITAVLPEDCIAHILSFTSPKDACRSSVVSPAFRLAADSDDVWERFLPSDYREMISRASSLSVELDSLPKKELYFRLCNEPIILDDGTMSLALERVTGKWCYMLAASTFDIVWGNTPAYWEWKSLPESRFPEVAELKNVWWLDFTCRRETRTLTPNTTHRAYLVYRFAQSRHGFQRPVKLKVTLEGREDDAEERSILLDPPRNRPRLSRERGDGWMEIEMGEFFNEHGDDGMLVCSLKQINCNFTKGGLIVEGIELRPQD